MADNSKLFNIPIAERTEPEVKPASVFIDGNERVPASELEAIRMQKEFNFMLESFKVLATQYDVLIKTMINRGKILNLEMPAKALAEDNPLLHSSLISLFGEVPETLSYEKFVALIEHEHQIATIQASRAVTDDVDAIKGEALKLFQSKEVQAIKAVKDSFTEYLKQVNAEEYLLVITLVGNKFNAGSSAGQIANFNSTISPIGGASPKDGSLDTNFTPENIKEEKDAFDKIVEDCIPCLDRTISTFNAFSKSMEIKDLKDMIWRNLLSQWQQFSSIHLSFADNSILKDICSAINIFTNHVCLPDIVSLLSMLKMMLAKLQKLMSASFNIDVSLPGDLISYFVSSILGMLMNYLTQIIATIMSPVDCIIDSLEVQSRKVGLNLSADDIQSLDEQGLAYVSKYKGVANKWTKEQTDVLKEYGIISTITKSVSRAYKSIFTDFEKVTREFNALSDSKVEKNVEIMDLFQAINHYKMQVEFLLEIYAMAKTYKKLGDVKWNKKLYRTICETTINNAFPWLETMALVKPKKETTSKQMDGSGTLPSGDKILPPQDYNLIPGLDKPDINPNEDEITSLLLVDKSLPQGFFDVEDIETLLDNPLVAQALKNLDYSRPIWQGENPLILDEAFIQRYKQLKAERKTLQLEYLNSGVKGSPVNTVVIGDCLKANELEGFTEDQINQWINTLINK